jgi:hypothetical protein
MKVSKTSFCIACFNSLLFLIIFSLASPLIRHASAADGSISGTVLRSADSTPIEGVYVDAYDNNWNYVTSGYTDSSGNYSITGLESGNYYLQTFNTLGLIDRYYGGGPLRAGAVLVAVADGLDTPSIGFNLDSGAGSISGRVTRSSDGRGLSGINLIAYVLVDATNLYVASVYTDFRGRYTIPGLGMGWWGGSYYIKTVNATTLGYRNEYYNNVPVSGGAVGVNVSSGADTGNISFALDLGGIISGRVTRASDGAGIPNAQVRIYSDPLNVFGSMTTINADSDGYYRFTSLAAGYYIVLASAPGYANQDYRDDLSYMGSPVHVSLGEELSNTNFVLQLGGSISGRITRDSDGAGISGASITAWNANKFGGGFGSIDSSGNYSVPGLEPGYYYVQVSSSGYAGEYYPNALDRNTATVVAVNPSVDISNINVSLASTPRGSISGTVVRDSDGMGILFATVRAYDTSWNLAGSASTGFASTGAYSITLPTGDYYVATYSVSGFVDMYYSNVYSPGSASLVTVTQDMETPNINFRMADAGRAIAGRVTRDSDGAGINAVPLQVYDTNWKPVKTGSTSYSGNYTITGLAPGSYYISTNNIGRYIEEFYNNSPSSSGAALVVVPPDANATGIDFALAAGGSLAGTVVQESNSTGIQGVFVDLYDTNWDYVASNETDASGNFRIEGLTAGASYYVKTRNSLGYIDRYCHDTAFQSKAAKITLMEDRAWVEIRLAKPALPLADFTDDLKSDAAVWRPGAGYWYVLNSDGSGDYTATQWGVASDLPVPGDYDGDGMADVAVYRPDAGMWYILPSGSQGTYTSTAWGMLADIAVPADYDGDDITDIAVWRPDTATWYIIPSTGAPGTYRSASWGSSEDVPVPADYDGDGKTDLATWRPGNATWYVMPSESPGTYTTTYWGAPADKPVPGDYDRDGKADQGIWRPATGMWHILPSNAPGTYTSIPWGTTDDIPVPGDYDGDGTTDIAVWRPADGTWYIQPSASPGTYISTPWGQSGDVPVSAITGIIRSLP